MSNRTPEITEAYLQAFQELGHKRLKEINGKEQEGHYYTKFYHNTLFVPVTVLVAYFLSNGANKYRSNYASFELKYFNEPDKHCCRRQPNVCVHK